MSARPASRAGISAPVGQACTHCTSRRHRRIAQRGEGVEADLRARPPQREADHVVALLFAARTSSACIECRRQGDGDHDGWHLAFGVRARAQREAHLIDAGFSRRPTRSVRSLRVGIGRYAGVAPSATRARACARPRRVRCRCAPSCRRRHCGSTRRRACVRPGLRPCRRDSCRRAAGPVGVAQMRNLETARHRDVPQRLPGAGARTAAPSRLISTSGASTSGGVGAFIVPPPRDALPAKAETSTSAAAQRRSLRQLLREIAHHAVDQVRRGLTGPADRRVAHHLRQLGQQPQIPIGRWRSARGPSRCPSGTACIGRSFHARRTPSGCAQRRWRGRATARSPPPSR